MRSIRTFVLILLVVLGVVLGDRSHVWAQVSQDRQERMDTAAVIRFWQGRIQLHPQGHLEYLLLSESLLRRSRETGDVSYLIQAEEAARQALQLIPDPKVPDHRDAQALLAQILYSLHRFPEALSLAQPLAESGSIRALATTGDLYLALGEYDRARASYQRWADLKPTPSLYSRQAALAAVTSDPEVSLQVLQQAIRSAEQVGEMGEPLAWHEHQLGFQLFTLGRLQEAEIHFQRALDRFPHYYLAQAGLGRIRAAQGELTTAIDLFKQATEQIPQPDLLSTLADLYTLTGQTEAAERCLETVDLIGELAQIQRQVYNRQLVYSWVDHDRHLQQALELALAELEIRKDIWAWDVVAWAYYKKGQFDLAQTAIEHAQRFHTRHPLLLYHAGLIALARGDHLTARTQLTQALEINPAFDPLQSRHAQIALNTLTDRS